jgi:anti-sigma B factor antagonist
MEHLVGVDIETRRDDVVVARLTGELDISLAESVGRQIAEAMPSSARGVVVDMSRLDFLDSSGVSMLFGLVRKVRSHRQELHIVAPAGTPVTRVLEIVEFDRAAPIHADADAAIAAIATPPESQPPPG